jgi:hypothetical protein
MNLATNLYLTPSPSFGTEPRISVRGKLREVKNPAGEGSAKIFGYSTNKIPRCAQDDDFNDIRFSTH